MKSKLHALIMCFIFLGSSTLLAQQQTKEETHGLTYTGKAKSMRIVPSLASKSTLNPAEPLTEEPQDGRYSLRKSKVEVVPGKDPQTQNDFYSRNPGRLDKTIQLTRSLEDDFVVNNNVGSPSDPALAVGLNHTVIVYNTGFIIYDKDGNDLTGPLNVNNIFSNGGCCDLTASYDNAADRWVLTYLFVGAGLELAVSDGPDPTTANWFIYSFPQVNDYNKLSIWRDGYYITDNGANDVWAIDRTAALAGDANANIQGFNIAGVQGQGFTSAQVFNVTDDNLPTTGGAPLVYMRDDGFAGVANDEIRIWTVNVDFLTPANSNVSPPEIFPTTPFINVFDGGNFANLTQPGGGTDIDALQSAIMNQAQFRKFPTHNSAIFNFVVDTDAGAGELAGIRWYEFRQTGDGQPWTMFQEGTFNAPDGKHAWMGSMAMDAQGNIGLGYSSMAGPTTPNPTDNRVGAFYTGRFASDDPGVMSIAEEEIGKAGNIAGFRFGDYAKIDVDPSNDKNFWFITEYQNTNHVAVFRIAPNTINDVGVINIDTPTNDTLTNNETVTVTVFNFGESDASGFDVTYQVDGGATITEGFVGTLASQTSAQHTFTTTADLSIEGQTYTINSCTVLSGDEDVNNDCTSTNIQSLPANDIGITAITSPSTGEGLTNESITVTIENFGTVNQSNFDVSYAINGGTPVIETVTGPLNAGSTLSYTFTTLADLSTEGVYEISSSSLLPNDSVNENNTFTTSVTNQSCESIASADTPITIPTGVVTVTSIINFPNDFIVSDVNVTLNIAHPFNEDLDIFLIAPNGTAQVELTTDNEAGGANFTNTVFDSDADTSITDGSSPYTGVFRPEGNLSDFNGLQSAGDWTLSVTDDFTLDGGELLNWTLQLCSEPSLSIDDRLVQDDLIIIHEGNDQYKVKLPTSSITERLSITVYNMLGQKLSYNTLENKTGQGYEYNLDMSYVASGIYLVRIGNKRAGNVKRIIVE